MNGLEKWEMQDTLLIFNSFITVSLQMKARQKTTKVVPAFIKQLI